MEGVALVDEGLGRGAEVLADACKGRLVGGWMDGKQKAEMMVIWDLSGGVP